MQGLSCVCGCPKAVISAERLCPVTTGFKNDVTLSQPDHAEVREADSYNGSVRFCFMWFIGQESLY